MSTKITATIWVDTDDHDKARAEVLRLLERTGRTVEIDTVEPWDDEG